VRDCNGGVTIRAVDTTFISYASPNRAIADAICSGLEAEGVPCWIAPRNIAPGAPWNRAIVEGVVRSRCVLVLLSTASNGSSGVSNEVGIAGRRGIPLLPLRLEDVEPSTSLEYDLGNLQRIDAFPPPIEPHLPMIVSAVRGAGGPEPAPSDDAEAALQHDAAAGDGEAATRLGFLSLERGDLTTAEEWFRRGGEAGDALAATNLGLLTTESDPDAAEHWLRVGAEGGDAMAATTLGMRLRERGDSGAAEHWLRRGADAGDVMAATNLGLVLRDRGDLDGARHWLQRGTDGGDTFAADQLRELDDGG
jgi:TPR repeat protein